MREIKFRAQNFGGYWRYSDKCKNGMTEFFSYFTTLEGQDTPVLNQNTLCQFTGLKDKNGKEIYEGDVVKVDSKYFRVLRFDVDCEQDYVGAVWKDDELSQFNIGGITKNIIPRKDLAKRYYEVIGDIYSTPELLS